MTTGAGGCQEINAENSQTDRHADRKAAARSPHVRGASRGRRREMRRSGAAALHGLNEAQQDCRARRRSPTCVQAHTLPRTGRHARCSRRDLSLEVQSHFSPSQPLASIRPSNAHKHNTHAQTHFSSSLASTSITLRSSSLRFPSPLAICSFINHHSALLLCACAHGTCAGEGVRADLGVARVWVKVGSCARMQNHKLVCTNTHGFPKHRRHVTTSCFFHVQL